jgi:hypothetical protein
LLNLTDYLIIHSMGFKFSIAHLIVYHHLMDHTLYNDSFTTVQFDDYNQLLIEYVILFWKELQIEIDENKININASCILSEVAANG